MAALAVCALTAACSDEEAPAQHNTIITAGGGPLLPNTIRTYDSAITEGRAAEVEEYEAVEPPDEDTGDAQPAAAPEEDAEADPNGAPEEDSETATGDDEEDPNAAPDEDGGEPEAEPEEDE